MNIELRSIDSEERVHVQKRLLEEIDGMDKDALTAILNSRQGRWFLMRLFDRCQMFADTFTGNSKTFQLEGMRKVGLLYLQDITNLGLDAIKLKQQAELEYIEGQEDMVRLISRER